MINKFKFRHIIVALGIFATSGEMNASQVINVPCVGDDQTRLIQQALVKASFYKGEEVTIRLEPGTYHLHRNLAAQHIYHVSNTTSEKENPNPSKHIGIWMKDMENIIFDGSGSTILTHGELSTFVVDNCKNIKLTNFKVDAADPTVVEINITKVGDDFIEFDILPPSQFIVKNGMFLFKGEGWRFGDGKLVPKFKAIAQIYDPVREMTLRTPSPIHNYTKAEVIGDNSVRMFFDYKPEVHPGERYQLRHSIRNEACMFLNNSKDIEVSDVDFNFMGNFGAVSQFSKNITFDNIKCVPSPESGRTNAGFADFLQFSSCKGKVQILNSRFSGSQDDPINIHGTHLQVVKTDSINKIVIAYRHPQTFGFPPFKPGDELALVNRESLNYEGETAMVESVKPLNNYNYELVLNKKISSLMDGEIDSKYVVENISWTPEVLIKGNYFSLTPTRAILISTRGRSVIEDNIFYHIPLASILVADDANYWYESGPVSNLSIRNNIFIDCESPIIQVAPEVKEFKNPVHSNISIMRNKFISPQPDAIDIRDSQIVAIRRNTFVISPTSGLNEDDLIKLENVTQSNVKKNLIVSPQE